MPHDGAFLFYFDPIMHQAKHISADAPRGKVIAVLVLVYKSEST